MFRKLRFYYLIVLTVLKKEWKKVSLVGVIIILAGLVLLSFAPFIYGKLVDNYNKIVKPTYSEALIGKPTTFNPLLSKTAVEKEINSLVFRGLMKVGPKGQLVPDLAESVNVVSPTEYQFKLRRNVTWQDGVKFTAADVVYTVQTAQNPNFESELESNFHDVDVKQIDDYTVSFKLKEAFAPFLTATTVGIIPKHISLSNYRPIGTGNFKFVLIKGDQVILEGSKNKLLFKFYPSQDAAVTALKLGEVHAIANLEGSVFAKTTNLNTVNKILPLRLVLAFFNTRSNLFSEKEKTLRQALTYALNKPEIVSAGIGQVAVDSMPFFKQTQMDAKEKYPYNPDKANTLLTNDGWALQSDGYRYKNGQKLEFTITTVEDAQFEDTAAKLKNAWQKIGASVTVKVVTTNDFKQSVVPNRSFDVLLTSQILTPDPDQYVLWHSTQTQGSNISGIALAKLDKLLEDGRKNLDQNIRNDRYQEFTRLLLDEAPAIFLYYPNYTWVYSKRITNVDLKSFVEPADRFANADRWEIERPLW